MLELELFWTDFIDTVSWTGATIEAKQHLRAPVVLYFTFLVFLQSIPTSFVYILIMKYSYVE